MTFCNSLHLINQMLNDYFPKLKVTFWQFCATKWLNISWSYVTNYLQYTQSILSVYETFNRDLTMDVVTGVVINCFHLLF